MQERTAITTQDGAGKKIVTNTTLVVSSRAEQCFYALLMWIKIMLAQDRYIAPGDFTSAILTDYCNHYHTKTYLNNKETKKMFLKPDRFTEKTSFFKWHHQLDNFSGSLIGKATAPITCIMRKDSTPLSG